LKFAKTCVEKKRRDRINRCLEELKDLMSQADEKAKYQKLEKAEILEMAVQYMKSLKQNSDCSQNTTLATQTYYTAAYRQCMTELQSFLNVCPGVKDDFKMRVLGHLSQRYTDISATVSQKQAANGKYNELKQQQQSVRYSPYYTAASYAQQQQQYQQNVYNLQGIKLNGFNSSSISSYDESTQQAQQHTENKLASQKMKFGGSCSSLDSYVTNTRPISPSEDSSSASSLCSSPVSQNTNSASQKMSLHSSVSSLNISNVDVLNTTQGSDSKMWRPW